ncbi:MAG TPA: ATP-binding protein, partial [Pirellulaceae bacterium]|nr:ATP-binding protein [Pirellulaceae bacterium]
SSLAPDPQPGVAIVLHDVTELRQLEAVRRDFVANVSHELKTPLASIKAYAETLRLGALYDQDKNQEFLQQIEHQAQLLDAQIHDLLRLAKVESGQAVFDIANLAVFPLCQHAVHTHAAEARARGVSLILEKIPEELKVKADADGVTTILNNLITNAIRYTPSGGTVRVSAKAQEDAVMLEVHDTGIGIAPEHQRRIFERFYRVDRARSREAGGTGLGLSIVKHLCQSLGGSVHLTSQPGKGSTFRVQLPLAH